MTSCNSVCAAALFAASLFVSAVPAQELGSVNQDAPWLTQCLEFSKGRSVEVRHKAILWAAGTTVEDLLQAKDGEDGRDRFNEFAARKPLGSLVTKGRVYLEGTEIEGGEYSLFFTIGDEQQWVLNLAGEGELESVHHAWPLAPGDAEAAVPRLSFVLAPAERSSACVLTIAFGAWVQDLHFTRRPPRAR